MPKKKFRDTRVGKFILGKNGVASVLADSIPDKGLLGLVKNLITTDDKLSVQDKETAMKLLEMDELEMDGITDRWIADSNSESTITRIARPIIVLYLTFALSVYIVLDSLGIFTISDEFVLLLQNLLISCYVAYFGSRGFEKYAKIKK